MAVGYFAFNSNQPISVTDGFNNTAVGSSVLRNNTYGAYNTANGFHALFTNTTGYNNTASGAELMWIHLDNPTKGMQEQQAMIEKQKQIDEEQKLEITMLENRLAKLEAALATITSK